MIRPVDRREQAAERLAAAGIVVTPAERARIELVEAEASRD